MPWAIFHYDLTTQQHGAPCPSSAEIVQPGHYIMLSTGENWESFLVWFLIEFAAGGPIAIGLHADLPHPHVPIISTASVHIVLGDPP